MHGLNRRFELKATLATTSFSIGFFLELRWRRCTLYAVAQTQQQQQPPTGLYCDASVRTWRRLCRPAVHTSSLMYYGRSPAGRKHRLIMRRIHRAYAWEPTGFIDRQPRGLETSSVKKLCIRYGQWRHAVAAYIKAAGASAAAAAAAPDVVIDRSASSRRCFMRQVTFSPAQYDWHLDHAISPYFTHFTVSS